MNQMNVAGMNPGAGGPVGGIPMMNNGSSALRSDPGNQILQGDNVVQLNTYIYDYFLKRGYHDCARALIQDESFTMSTSPVPKSTPHRRDGEMNGVDGDAMVTDSKDEVKHRIPDDMPRPNIPPGQGGDFQQTSFLLDWFNLFWDIFWAQRKRSKNPEAMQYVQQTQQLLRMQNQQMLRQSQMIPGQYNMRAARGGMMPAGMQKTLLQNNPNMTPQQMAQLQKNQQMLHHQMQRETSEMEMNGHRPQSPSSAENAPSPSKRPRLDSSQVNGLQMAPNGRGQGQMPGRPNHQTNAMLIQHGINPNTLTPQQFTSFQAQNPSVQAKSLQVYNQNMGNMSIHNNRAAMNNPGMPNGLMNPGVMPNQGDMMPMHDGQLLPMQEYYSANGQMTQVPRPQMQTPGSGNHALQDYQMQLMLLEQQNKRRLLLARQEQDGINRGDGQAGMPGQPNLPPGTSPQGSRAGASPNPNDQMKRGTPKMPQTGLPGSPSVNDAMAHGRSSPASMNFGGQMPQEMGGGAFFINKSLQDGVVQNGMRPPSSNPAFSGPQMTQPMDAMSRPQGPGGPGGNRMPGGNWQGQGPPGQPMVPQQQQVGQQQPQPAGTPQERNAMPPPQAPPAGVAGTGRTQPSSPQAGAAPPTPQQSNKPAPKGKKDPKENPRKRPPKKPSTANASNTAATPSSEVDPPPTPTPPTPITPVHPSSFNKNNAANNAAANNANANTNVNGPQPTSASNAAQQQQNLVQQQQAQQQQQQAQQQQAQQQQQQDPGQTFGDMNLPDANNFNLDFTTLDNPDILENFDFDSFLNTDDPNGFAFDPSMPYPDGVEAGAGENL
ncbi:hypothetical protein ACO22_01347 [Paracoccidioides brasiliensis]|uniref:Uncharacterized protein n=1 Tax=Paracoccidioides brasiliensis TaxID=121759 RepID=A0A1D2JM72_PARBR|nr:hypothetical protein ACO22_01347 [Paracoccidioides brasiliensis]